jgi:hypothetical protein
MLNNNIRREELLMYDSIKIPIRPYVEVENLTHSSGISV